MRTLGIVVAVMAAVASASLVGAQQITTSTACDRDAVQLCAASKRSGAAAVADVHECLRGRLKSLSTACREEQIQLIAIES